MGALKTFADWVALIGALLLALGAAKPTWNMIVSTFGTYPSWAYWIIFIAGILVLLDKTGMYKLKM